MKDVGYVIVSLSYLHTNVLLTHSDAKNYDFPNNCEDYIHRIGRTGVSILLVWPCDILVDGAFSSVLAQKEPLTLTSRRRTPSPLVN